MINKQIFTELMNISSCKIMQHILKIFGEYKNNNQMLHFVDHIKIFNTRQHIQYDMHSQKNLTRSST